jgi:hypothetical protein
MIDKLFGIESWAYRLRHVLQRPFPAEDALEKGCEQMQKTLDELKKLADKETS